MPDEPISENQLESEFEPAESESDRQRTNRRFYQALACFAGIALLAWFTLDGKFLGVVWIFLAGLAVKTYLAKLQKP